MWHGGNACPEKKPRLVALPAAVGGAQPRHAGLPAVGRLGHAGGAVAAVAEVVGHGPVGGGADVRRHVGAGATVVSAHVNRGVGGVGVAIDVTGTGAIAAPHGTVIGAVVGSDVSAAAAVVPAHP